MYIPIYIYINIIYLSIDCNCTLAAGHWAPTGLPGDPSNETPKDGQGVSSTEVVAVLGETAGWDRGLTGKGNGG